MTHETFRLIAKQQLEIERLKEHIFLCEKKFGDIRGVLYSCGGPLNDNFLHYNEEQLKLFTRIFYLTQVGKTMEEEVDSND